MTYQALQQIIREECAGETAERILTRARLEMGGMRVTIAAQEAPRPLRREHVTALGSMTRTAAARKLGVTRHTIARALQRR